MIPIIFFKKKNEEPDVKVDSWLPILLIFIGCIIGLVALYFLIKSNNLFKF